MLEFEDDVVIEFLFNQLEVKNLYAKMMHVRVTESLNGNNTRQSAREMLSLLLSTQANTVNRRNKTGTTWVRKNAISEKAR